MNSPQNCVVLLGTKGGPAIRTGSSSPTSNWLTIDGQGFVVDCGLGVSRGLVEAGVALKDLSTILITHLHSDHVLELGPLLHTAWTAGLKTPVNVYGPPGIQDYWDGFCSSLSFDIDIRIADEGRPVLAQIVSVHTYGEGEVVQMGDLGVTALRVDHPPVTDCFALKFQTPGHKVVFSSDTTFFPPLAEFAQDADVLIHEAMDEDEVDKLVARVANGTRLKAHLLASHTSLPDVARIAAAAKPRHLILNHLLPADDPDYTREMWHSNIAKLYQGKVTIGSDGLRVAF